ncbi:MAG: phosphatase PAP2 family protein [Armatimonadota bacterium]|nr:phosphatase PAP2 family protein [Armatimonadota bacterium]
MPGTDSGRAGQGVPPRYRKLTALGLVALTLLLTAVTILYVDPIRGPLEAEVLQRPVVDGMVALGRHLGGWDLAPALLAVALIAAGYRWRRLLVTTVVGYAIQTGSTELLKQITGRARPRQMEGPIAFFGWSDAHHSFPSGHASFAFLFATIIGAYFPRVRWLAYSYAVFVSLTRLIADAHYVSDLLFGALIGILSGFLVLYWWPPQPARPLDGPHARPTGPPGARNPQRPGPAQQSQPKRLSPTFELRLAPLRDEPRRPSPQARSRSGPPDDRAGPLTCR